MIEYPTFDTNKAQVLYIDNFYGKMLINVMTISNHKGMMGDFFNNIINDGS